MTERDQCEAYIISSGDMYECDFECDFAFFHFHRIAQFPVTSIIISVVCLIDEMVIIETSSSTD